MIAAPLGNSEIHLWYLDQDAAKRELVEAHFARLATAHEKEQSGRFLSEPKKKEFMATRAFIRTVLSQHANVTPADWQFKTNANGAPEIESPTGLSCPASAGMTRLDLKFSISHSSGLIVVAVALDRELGVDVEKRSDEIDVIAIAKTAFSPKENAILHRLSHSDAIDRFNIYWTLKEAYIKARGAGFSIPTRAFSMQIESEQIQIAFGPEIDDDPETWGFRSFAKGASHQVALAFRKKAEAESVGILEHTFTFHGLS